MAISSHKGKNDFFDLKIFSLKENVNMKPDDNNTGLKPILNKTANPNSKQLKVKGKPISDIETLRDFLTKKKLERAEKGIATNNANHTQRSQNFLQRDQPTADTVEPERIKRGLEIDAKGDTVSDVTITIGQNKLKRCDKSRTHEAKMCTCACTFKPLVCMLNIILQISL